MGKMSIKYQHLPLQGLPKYFQIRTFGLKIYHLATLDSIEMYFTEMLAIAFAAYVAAVILVIVAGWQHKLDIEREIRIRDRSYKYFYKYFRQKIAIFWHFYSNIS
jgi:hypothetical protein